MSNLLKYSIIATHLVSQVVIYGFLAFSHGVMSIGLWVSSAPTPALFDFLKVQSVSLLVSLIIALFFIDFERTSTSFRLNAILFGLNFIIFIVHSIYCWNFYT